MKKKRIEQIFEDNLVLGKFMDIRFREDGIVSGFPSCLDMIEMGYDSKFDLRFHESWDWLKPVIAKIVKSALDESDKGKLIIMSDYYREIADFSIIAEIGPVYDKVVKFVKWYSQLIRINKHLDF